MIEDIVFFPGQSDFRFRSHPGRQVTSGDYNHADSIIGVDVVRAIQFSIQADGANIGCFKENVPENSWM